MHRVVNYQRGGLVRDASRQCARFRSRERAAPSVLISASAVGWHGPHGDAEITESAEGRPSFGNEVCGAWETKAREAARHGVRVVVLRLGIVLGIDGGMLSQLLPPFEFGLGARIGSGRHWMSWIERDDAVRLIARAAAAPRCRRS